MAFPLQNSNFSVQLNTSNGSSPIPFNKTQIMVHLSLHTTKAFFLALFFLTYSNVGKAANIDSLYYVCDGGDFLWKINRTTGATTPIGNLGGPTNVEAIAFWSGNSVLYGASAGDFGSISRVTGLWSSIGEIDGGGTANGAEGALNLDDVDGLSFDPWTGILWASNRRSGSYDLLFQIDPSTGLFVSNAFGPNIDYLVIDGSGVFTNIDDIAISPINGIMYTTSTQGGSSQVVTINKYTGAVSVETGSDRGDIEGMSYHNDGTFWGTIGDADEFIQINPVTGVSSNNVDLSDANCSDPEAIAALVADINLVQGTVFDDVDLSQTLNGVETGIAGVTVFLYYDANGDGMVNTGDILLQEETTLPNGTFEFEFAAEANLITIIDPFTLPAGFGLTTINNQTTTFVGFGQTDGGNNFGATTGTDTDGDGIPDHTEGTVADSDFDGVPNYLDLDSDNDGILDSDEGIADTDFDGIPNYLDLDSDNDGITDAIEGNGGALPPNYSITIGRIMDVDTDGDGLLDAVDNAPGTAYTAASTSSLPKPDTDGDSIDDYVDLDADGDGILDLTEAGGADVDGDGEYDGFMDGNGDGLFDGSNVFPLPITNTDSTYEVGSGLPLLPDYLDLDSDNDGVTDNTEGFATGAIPAIVILSDCDYDGVLDLYDIDKGGSAATPFDMDNDGIPDYIDLDTDGDGIADNVESNDGNTDGVADNFASGIDADMDGIDDQWDTDLGNFGGGSSVPLQNQDGDNEPDWRDMDDTNNPGTFYYVCDATDQVYSYNSTTGTSTFIGAAGAADIEAIAYWPTLGLYGADDGDFGSINLTTGAYTSIGEIDGGGTASGVLGPLTLNDVDGLSFDPWTGILWATNRRSSTGDYDLLFQIDPATGLYIPNAFGNNIDYLVVDGSNVFDDIDDLAISPVDGELYTVGNDGTNDQLLKINKFSGAITVVDALTVQDVEGMSYSNNGTFYGTDGSGTSEIFEIDPSDGNMTSQSTLACGDVEAVAALVAPLNTISGTVFDDANFSQNQNMGETGIANVIVNLYYDTNGDGTYDPGEPLLQSDTTDNSGNYDFEFGTTANLILVIDESTLPPGYALTTDNLETVAFTDGFNFGEDDPNNDFGAATDADCDGDGIPDFAEGGTGVDSDGDGIDNECDLDSDNDGILDEFEGLADADGDGIPNYIDLDSDNDGISDAIEANDGVAPSGYNVNNGRIAGVDADNDGLVDAIEGVGNSSTLSNNDHDGDGLVDAYDLDADNDGIVDAIEAGGTDANGDGFNDNFTDGNGDGYNDNLNSNPLTIPNTDGHGNPDYIDMDADNDGLDDTLEGLITGATTTPTTYSDVDNDGIIDFWDTNFGGTSIQPVDTDGDGTPDYQDLDSDNDTVSDVIEGNDANGDGTADYTAALVDTDGDGILDAYDDGCVITGGVTVASTDYAEEDAGGTVDLGSSDLELVNDGGLQTVALYFPNIPFAQGATIPPTYIQFETDEVSTGSVTVTFTGEDIDNASPFSGTPSELSNRLAANSTSASITWSPVDWNTVQEAGVDQQTTDLSAIIQELVNRPSWSLNNDIVIFVTGSGSNDRTAENDPFLFFAQNNWGCATNTPHQNFDGDLEDDWRDVDDDGDGILTADEVPDVDGSGQVDYLEVSACPAGQVASSTLVNGNADAVLASNSTNDPTNALGAPDAAVASINAGGDLDLDLTDTLPAGTTVAVDWRKVSGGGNARTSVYWSANGTSGWTFIQQLSTTSTSIVTQNITLPDATRYLRFERDNRVIGLDAVSYSITQTVCLADFDNDGIPDAIDLDDDNDGILDTAEGNGDFDMDGINDQFDLDSDNDGIPDAVEANEGFLPPNMTPEGQYPGSYVALNDPNNNGWAADVDNGEGGTNLVDTDTDMNGDPDRTDLDSDEDGITDAVEANGGVLPDNMNDSGQYPAAYANANDADGDGLVDDVDTDAGGTALPNPDTDGDGLVNYRDLDSDGDSIIDYDEGFTTQPPLSGDGNMNGLDDSYETSPADLPDLDCNNIADYLDLVIFTAQSGSFTDPSTWVGGIIPLSTQTIVIQNGHTLTLSGNTNITTITVEPTGELDINGFDLHVFGSFYVNGVFLTTTGKVFFDGGNGCAQTICGGTITFNDWEIENPDGVQADCGSIRWTGILTLTEGTLDACDAGDVRLVSNSLGTGSIAGTGTGDITCDIKVQRYKSGCGAVIDYFGIASFVTTDYNAWNDDLLTTGFTGSDFPNFFFNNFTYYDEPTVGVVDSGWMSPQNITDVVERGRGYYTYQWQPQLPALIDVVGEVDLNQFQFPVDYTLNGDEAADGYNLIGNPFPSSIRWDLNPGNGWTNVGCCDAIFIYDDCNAQYATYVGGVGVNGGTDIIAQSQAFHIKAHIPGASLAVDRTAMVTDEGDFRSSMMNEVFNLFYIDIDNGQHYDQTVIRLDPNATLGFDNPIEATKFLTSNTTYAPTIYTKLPSPTDSLSMAINSIPQNDQDIVVEMYAKVSTSGVYNLQFNWLGNWPQNMCILIEDLQTGLFINPQDMLSYPFNISQTPEAYHRFNIHFSYPLTTAVQDVHCFREDDGYATLNMAGSGPYDIVWKDMIGNVLQTNINTAATVDTLWNLSAGTYYVEVYDLGAPYCSNFTDTVVVGGSAQNITLGSIIDHVGCDPGSEGSINVTVYGATPPFLYQWSNSATTQDIGALAPGNYTLQLTDALGCTEDFTYTIEDQSETLQAAFAAPALIGLSSGLPVQFTNQSTDAYNYVWTFGDSTAPSTAEHPMHLYTDTGFYTVELIAMGNYCTDTITQIIEVRETAAGIDNGSMDVFASNVWQQGTSLQMTFANNSGAPVTVGLFNSAGQMVATRETNGLGRQQLQFNMSSNASGTYFLRIIQGQNSATAKVNYIE